MREQVAEQPVPRNSVDWERFEAQFDSEPISDEDRLLTEVDQLNANRLSDGRHSAWTLSEQFKNMLSATKEAAMPYAVTRTEHAYQGTGERDDQGRRLGTFMWLGKTAVENATSGYKFHRHPEARRRVGIEVDEARDSINLRPGITKIFISPRMTEADASHEEAKAEHLADDDAVRTGEVMIDEDGNIQKKVTEALLFRGIPLKAWVAFLNDPNNSLFGRSIGVEDDGSATSVMEAHGEMEVESDKLPHGVISVVEAVTPYIEDPDVRADAEVQLGRFHESQEDMHSKAVNIAKRWQDFEVDLADSIHEERAVPAVRNFINSMQSRWGDKYLQVILEHQLPDGHYTMSRKLAAILEKAKQNLLWTRAAVVTGNEKVLEQLSEETATGLYRDEMFIQAAADNGGYAEILALEAETDRTIAKHNVKVGGGCAGDSETDFNSDDPLNGLDGAGGSSNESKVGKISRGKCVVESCPTRPGRVKVGGCGVCLERCQKMFDRGRDPTKMKSARKQAGKMATRPIFPSAPPEAPKPKRREVRSHEFALAA